MTTALDYKHRTTNSKHRTTHVHFTCRIRVSRAYSFRREFQTTDYLVGVSTSHPFWRKCASWQSVTEMTSSLQRSRSRRGTAVTASRHSVCQVNIVPDMTYNVFGGTLNLAQSVRWISASDWRHHRLLSTCLRPSLPVFLYRHSISRTSIP